MQIQKQTKNFNNNTHQLLKLFGYASHEGQYVQGFEAAYNNNLLKTSLLFINNLEKLTFEKITLLEFKNKALKLLDDYFNYYPDNIDFDELDELNNSILNDHFNNNPNTVKKDITEEVKGVLKNIPLSDNLTLLILEFFNNLKLFCLGLWNVEGFEGYINDFCDSFEEFYYMDIIQNYLNDID